MTLFRLTESRTSRSSTNRPATETLVYTAAGSNDPAYIRAIANTSTAAVISTTMGTLRRQRIDIDPIGFELWEITVTYGQRDRETGNVSWDFDTTGGTIHIETPIANRNKYPPEAPDQELIGFDGENAAGVDKPVPMLNINFTAQHPEGVVTIERVKELANATARINSTPFFTFEPGEVLFLGARGADGTEAEASVNYQCAMSANADGLKIGEILNVAKRGHDYLWVTYRKQEEDGKPVSEVEFVYVDQIYNEIDLTATLGFGY